MPWQEGLAAEEVRLETSGRATISPAVLRLLQPPRCSSATRACAVVAAGFWAVFPQVWVPLCQTNAMKTSRDPAGMPATISSGGTAPSHLTSTSSRWGRGRSSTASPALLQRAHRDGLSHPQLPHHQTVKKRPRKRVRRKRHSPNKDPWQRAAAGVGLKLSSLPGKSVALPLWAAKNFLK